MPPGPYPSRTFAERFWAKVPKGPDDQCWEWTGNRQMRGYGVAFIRSNPRTQIYAHRAMYLLTHGELPADKCVCHTCDNPPCVNPRHLWLGTPAENFDDMRAKGRDQRGVRSGTAKLSPDDVRAIRQSGLPGSRLGPRFGVSASNISAVRRRITWRHIK